MTYPEIDKASEFFLSSCLVLCDGLRLLPHEQYTMPICQYKAQSGHCVLEEVSHSSKISVLPNAGDQLLRPLAERILSLLSFSSHAGKTPCAGDSRTAESTV